MSWPARRGASTRIAAIAAVALCHAACQPSTRPAVAPQAPPGGAVQRLAYDLDAVLDAPTLARGSWGVVVRSLDRGDTLYARHADRLLLPASNMKILTLAAAGERLGWDFRFETRLLALGTIDGGVLQGDLFVVGSGDPTFVDRDSSAARAFAEWAVALRAAGIGVVHGRIVGDDRAFREIGLGAGWAWDDLAAGYASRVSALQFNDNVAGLLVTPGAAPGAPATVAVDPPATGLVVDNRVLTASPDTTASVLVERLPGSSTLTLTGSVPFGAPPAARTVSVENPPLFFAASLRRALVANGVGVEGPAATVDHLDAPVGGTLRHVILTHHSAPLAEIAVRMMKQSQNLHAESVLMAIGRQAGTPTAADAVRDVRATLEGWGLPPSAVVQADGSGLSRYNYVTADALVRVLEHVNRDESARAVFSAALPEAGRDGTLEDRFRGTPAEGRVSAKTGSMSGVRTLSGYLTDASGERLVFSILGNNADVPGADIDRAIDECVVRLTMFRR